MDLDEEIYPYNLVDYSTLPFSQLPIAGAPGSGDPGFRRELVSSRDLDFFYEERTTPTPGGGSLRQDLVCAKPEARTGLHQGYVARLGEPGTANPTGRLGGQCARGSGGQERCFEGLDLETRANNSELDCVPFERPRSNPNLPPALQRLCGPDGEPTTGSPSRVRIPRSTELIDQGRRRVTMLRIDVLPGAASCLVDGGTDPVDSGVHPDAAEPEPDAGSEPDAGEVVCGDSLQEEPDEGCDDGNGDSGDGCSSSCQIEAGWDCPPAAECTAICSDGLIVGPEECDPAASAVPPCRADCTLAPNIAVVKAYVSPILPEGVTSHFTGVSAYILGELTAESESMGVSCKQLEEDCTRTYTASPPSGNPPFSPRLSEVPINFLTPSGDYTFALTALGGGYTSPPFLLDVEIAPGVGVLRCEQSTNGLAGDDEVRWLGFELRSAVGAVMPNSDFHIFDRSSTGRGWNEHSTHMGVNRVFFSGSSSEISSTRTFQVIGVDRDTNPPSAHAAREFRYGDLPSGDTRGCTVCSIGPSGTCQIIPLM
jgi:cysteine-rich repeat protein